jgi:hypothetical protein
MSLDKVYTAKSCKGGERIRDALNGGNCQLREKTLRRKHRSSRITLFWCRVDDPTQKDDLSRNPKEDQGPHNAVESMIVVMMMMMMMIYLQKYTSLTKQN